jgi:hypothetical protein
MGKSSPSAPPPPDYAGAAAAQGAANVETARLQGRINNPNVIGPLGSQTVTFGTPTFNQAGYDQAMSAYQTNPRGELPRESQYSGEDGFFDSTGYNNAMNSWAAGRIAPTREQFTTNTNADQPTVTQTLTPAAQSTLDAQQRVQRALAGLGEQGIGTASNVLGNAFNPNLAGLQTNVGNAGQISQTPNLNQYGQAGGNINAGQISRAPELGVYGMAGANVNAQPVNAGPQSGQYGMAGAGPQAGQYGFAQGGLNTSNVAAMPVNAGMTGQQAIMNRLAPQLERADASTRQRLINQGLVPGGEAYENAMISQNQQKNDLLSQAALQGIGLDTAANAQGFNQALQAGQYGNQAVAQNFAQGQAANAAGNQAVGQNFGQGLAAQQAQNAASQQLYNQYMGVQGLQNQAVNQNQQAALAQYQAQLGGQQQGFGQNVTQQQLSNQAIAQNQQAALQQQQAALAAQNQQYNQLLQGAQFGSTAERDFRFDGWLADPDAAVSRLSRVKHRTGTDLCRGAGGRAGRNGPVWDSVCQRQRAECWALWIGRHCGNWRHDVFRSSFKV